MEKEKALSILRDKIIEYTTFDWNANKLAVYQSAYDTIAKHTDVKILENDHAAVGRMAKEYCDCTPISDERSIVGLIRWCAKYK